jgi:hypothetical protein
LHEKAVRVIVTTGYSDVQVAPGTVAAILRKPFSEEQLLAALKLKRFPTDLNRWDSQEITDGGVFGH